MGGVTLAKDLSYFVGEKPPALSCAYRDKDRNLVAAPLTGATLTAKCLLDASGSVEFSVTCTNNDDGTFTIDWATGGSASSFVAKGMLRIDVEVNDGTRAWFLPRFSVPIRTR